MAASPFLDTVAELRALGGEPRVTYDGGDPDYPITERLDRVPIGSEPAYNAAEPNATRFPNNVLVEKRVVGSDGHFSELYLRYVRLPGKTTTFSAWDDDARTRVYSDHFMASSGYTLPTIGDAYSGMYVVDARKLPLQGSPLVEVVIEYAAKPNNRIDVVPVSVNFPGWFEPQRSGDYYVWQRNDDGDFAAVNLASLVSGLDDIVVYYPVNFEVPSGISVAQMVIRPGVNVETVRPRPKEVPAKRTRVYLGSTGAFNALVVQIPKQLQVLAPGASSRVLGSWITENTVHPAFKVYMVDMEGDYQTLLLEEFEESTPPSYDPKDVYCVGAQVKLWRGAIYYLEILEASELGTFRITNTFRKVKVPCTALEANYLDRLNELGGNEQGFLLFAETTHTDDNASGKVLRIAGRKIGKGSAPYPINPVASEQFALLEPSLIKQSTLRWFRLYGVQLVDSSGEPTNATGTITVKIGVAKGAQDFSATITGTALGAVGDTLTVSRSEAGTAEAITYTWGTAATIAGTAEVTRFRIRNGSASLPYGTAGAPVAPAVLAISHGSTRYGIVVYRSDVGGWNNGTDFYTGVLADGATTVADANAIEVGVTGARTATQLRGDIKTVIDATHSGKWTTSTSDFTSVVVDTTGNVGSYRSMAVVNGYPAIAYYDTTNTQLLYARATDASGTAWSAPVVVDTTGAVGGYASMAVVNGYPAIAYHDFTNTQLLYARATDASGTAWSAPVIVDTAGDVGHECSLVVVNGNPAIAYRDATNTQLLYARATDASGTAWSAPVVVDTSADVGYLPSLAVVNGNPAIAYYDATNTQLLYARATDASGTAWGAPVVVDTAADVGYYPSLVVVNGYPAIAYHDFTNTQLLYARATDASGTAWSAPVVVDTAGSVGSFAVMLIVSSRPAIAYYDATNTQQMFVRASDADGTTWGTPAVVDTNGTVGVAGCSMVIVNGNPAVAYYDQTNQQLLYNRNTAVDGSDPWAAYDLILTHVTAGSVTDATENNFASGDEVTITTQGAGAAANTILWASAAADKATTLYAVLSNPTTAITGGYASAGSTTLAAITAGTVTVTLASPAVTLSEPYRAELDWSATTETGASVTLSLPTDLNVGTVVATIAPASSSAYPAMNFDNPDFKERNLLPRVIVTTEPIGVGAEAGLLGDADWKIGVGAAANNVQVNYDVSENLTDWTAGVDGPYYVSANSENKGVIQLFKPSDYATHASGTRTTKYVRLKLKAVGALQPVACHAFIELSFPTA